MNFPKT